MRALTLSFKSLRNRRTAAALTTFTIALSVALVLCVERVRTEARESFASTVSGTDLIVGARSGPINLLLYAVLHIGDATNNVSWESYREIAAWPEVAWSVPISLGDSHRGFRVMGTTRDFFVRYRYGARHPLALAEGRAFDGVYEAVIGAEVAKRLHYSTGQAIVLSHGTGRVAIVQHEDKPFRVVGVLARTGTPIDATVLVSLEAIEAIHMDWQSGTRVPGLAISAEDALRQDLTPKSITAFLLGLKNRIATFNVQRDINNYEAEPLLAILPGVTLQQLWSMVGVAENALRAISGLVVLVGLAGLVTALITTLDERRREMAVLRALGARPHFIFGLHVLEAGILTGTGILGGIVLTYLAIAAGRAAALDRFGLTLSLNWPSGAEWAFLATVVGGGLLAGCIPAFLAYQRTLADGMTVRT